MATTVLPVCLQDENLKPLDNVPQTVEAFVKPTEATPAQAPVVVPEPTEESVEDAEEAESEDDDSLIDEDEEDDEEVDDEDDQNFDDQCEWVESPLSFDEESREAIELANQIGLTSTDDAITRVGGNTDKRVSLTISKYSELIGHDREAQAFYETITQEITAMRNALESGVAQLASQLGFEMERTAVDTARSFMENYIRMAVDRSVIHCEYREQQRVSVQDVLSALSSLGRPLYWNGSQTSALVQEQEIKDEEHDTDFQPSESDLMEDDEEYETDEEDADMDTWEEKEDEEEDKEEAYLENNNFAKLVDVVNKSQGVTFSAEAYQALQASVEDYILQLLRAAGQTAQFAQRPRVTHEDIKFARSMSLRV